MTQCVLKHVIKKEQLQLFHETSWIPLLIKISESLETPANILKIMCNTRTHDLLQLLPQGRGKFLHYLG